MLSILKLSKNRFKTRDLIIPVLVLTLFPAGIFAQDKIYKADNTVIEAVVIKISDSQVDFKKFSNQNGPLYSVSKKDISMIIFQNGEKEVFSQPQVNTDSGKHNEAVASLKFGAISVENARAMILSENINNAIGVYSQLLKKDSTNITLNSEYAYALALGGIYDAALSRLDRIWESKGVNRYADYFASQVYALLGYEELADEFIKGEAKVVSPDWISSRAPVMLEKYNRRNHPADRENRNEMVNDFKRANKLGAKNYYLQSIALFEEITIQNPKEYLPYVGYSIVLDRAGFRDRSIRKLETAISLLGDNEADKETKLLLEKRLASVKSKSTTNGEAASSSFTPQMLLYAGGQLSSSYSSINARFGLFISKSSYTSIDAGFTGISGSTSANLGLMVYQRGRIFASGMGLTTSLSKDATVLYYKVSIGPSIMNKSHTASWDIFLDGKAPLTKGYPTTIGISIGRSIYFGKRK